MNLFRLFWGFATNLASPFFAVYMLQRLGLPLLWVIGLNVLGQLFNISSLRVWGSSVDRFGNKAVLSLSASLYLLVIFGWIFIALLERCALTVPLLVILHIFAGIAAAGVSLSAGTIGLKLAPQSEATPYLTGTSLATSLGAGLGPILGGLFADFFSRHGLNLTVTWVAPSSQPPALGTIGFGFLCGVAFILGVISLRILATLHEEGDVGRDVILGALMAPCQAGSIPGWDFTNQFPFGYLKRVPVPGLDVALGVIAYQVAEVARVAVLATVHGRGAVKKLVKAVVCRRAGVGEAGG